MVPPHEVGAGLAPALSSSPVAQDGCVLRPRPRLVATASSCISSSGYASSVSFSPVCPSTTPAIKVSQVWAGYDRRPLRPAAGATGRPSTCVGATRRLSIRFIHPIRCPKTHTGLATPNRQAGEGLASSHIMRQARAPVSSAFGSGPPRGSPPPPAPSRASNHQQPANPPSPLPPTPRVSSAPPASCSSSTSSHSCVQSSGASSHVSSTSQSHACPQPFPQSCMPASYPCNPCHPWLKQLRLLPHRPAQQHQLLAGLHVEPHVTPGLREPQALHRVHDHLNLVVDRIPPLPLPNRP